jgi:LmbE family N-acetylglucosaminyl deacetylase
VTPGLRRLAYRAARRGLAGLPPELREVALALAGTARAGPLLVPCPPPGPVLVVAPHPDDETIGAGGALARHALSGDAVTVLVATSGERTAGGRGDVAGAREAECRAACAELGVAEPVFLRLPDGSLAEHGDELTAAVGRYGGRSATVYLPSPLDPHPDHRAANVAAARVALPGEVYGYEVWAAGPVDVLLDVTTVYERKERALAGYRTALDSVDYVRACRGLAAYRSAAGGMGGVGYAEGFLRLSAADHAELCRRAGLL